MNKKAVSKFLGILLIFLMLVSVITIAMAKQPDEYDKEVSQNGKKIKLKQKSDESFVANLTLLSDLDHKVIDRGEGIYQKVAEFSIETDTKYHLLDMIEFYNVKTWQSIQRDFIVKERVEVDSISINLYSQECSDVDEGNGTYNKCIDVINGSKEQLIYEWEFVDLTKQQKKGYKVYGIFTDVQQGDKVEWIPHLLSTRIEEWATWTEALNTDILAFYKLDESSGTNAVDSVDGSSNMTFDSAPTWESGLINNEASVSTMYGDSGVDLIGDGSIPFSVSLWHTGTGGATNHEVVFQHGSNTGQAQGFNVGIDSSTKVFELTVFENNGVTINDATLIGLNDEFKTGTYQHIVLTFDGSGNWQVYWNGSIATLSDSVGSVGLPSDDLRIGYGVLYGVNYVGGLDEVGLWQRVLTSDEVSDLWNDGTGISYVGVFNLDPTITMESPENYFNTTRILEEVNYSCADDTNVTNMTLSFDGVENITTLWGLSNSTGLISTDFTLDYGYHNWSVTCYDDESASATETYFINMTNAIPTIATNTTPIDYLNSSVFPELVCIGEDDVELVNVSLLFNGNVVASDLTKHTNVNVSYTPTIQGYHNWSCFSEDNVSQTASSSTRYVNIDTINPTISLSESDGRIYYRIVEEGSLSSSINYIANDTHLQNVQYNVTHANGSVFGVFNDSANFSGVITFNMTDFGAYKLNILANDSFGNSYDGSMNFELRLLTGISSGDDQSQSGGGGGGFYPIKAIDSQTGEFSCDLYRQNFYEIVLEQLDSEQSFTEKAMIWWRAFWNYVLCESASSITPLEN